MQSFLITLVYGAGALLAVAVVVAWWEHVRQSHLAKNEPFVPQARPERASRVDVDLTSLPDETAAKDQAERKTTVDEAMARMVRAGGTTGSSSWTETRPMVGPGVTREAEPH